MEAVLPEASGSIADETITMVEVGDDRDQALTNLRIIAGNRKKSAVVAILKDRSAELVRKVLQAGAYDILFLPLELAPTMRLLMQIAAKRESLETVTSGKLRVVTSTIGGAGVTSLVGNRALALSYTFEKRVAAIDLDFNSSGLSSYLSLEPSRNISWLTSPGRQINSIELGSALTPHSSGIQLLAAGDLAEGSESIPKSRLSEVLNVMRQLFDYVIVDCGRTIDARVVQTWRSSDHLLYVLDQSINGIRCAWFQGYAFSRRFARSTRSFKSTCGNSKERDPTTRCKPSRESGGPRPIRRCR